MNGVEVAKERELGHAIAMARKAAGLTQQELCVKAELSYSTLAKIERGAIKTPSVFTVAAIAEATGTTVEALTGKVTALAPETPQKAYKTAKNGVSFVYFDVNGVLVRFFQRAFTALAHDTGVSPDGIEALFWRHNDAVNRGEMSLDEFNSILAKHVGLPSVSWMDYYLSNIDPIIEMHEVVAWASELFRIGLMSNIMPGFLQEMINRKLLPQVHYDAIIDSSQIGAIKPEAAMYDAAIKASGVQSSEILLIDDDRMNLMAAEKLGWHVMWFDDYHASENQARIKQTLAY
jgi:FMN phosphatase YigB (HAD superfamily)/DNA-binding XRE family transcriptional regulator